MSRMHPIEGLLGLLLVIGIASHLAAGADYSKRNFEFMPDMVETPGFEAQDPNPNFADGKTLRAPVPGTVARGWGPLMHKDVVLDVTTTDWNKMLPAQQTAWDAFVPHYVWDEVSDNPAHKRAMARGKTLFGAVCATCHGQDGKGGGLVTKRGVPPPPTLHDPKMRALSRGRLFRTITVGQGNMASHANQVLREERWMVIRYLEALQKGKQ